MRFDSFNISSLHREFKLKTKELKQSRPGQSFNQFVTFRYFLVFLTSIGNSAKQSPFILILKIIALLTLERSGQFKPNKKKFDTNIGGSIGGDKINEKDINLSNNIKKISSRVGFLTFKAK